MMLFMLSIRALAHVYAKSLMFKIAFLSFSNINHLAVLVSVCCTANKIFRVLCKHHREFPKQKKTIPMLVRPIYYFFDGPKTKFRIIQDSTLKGHTEEKKKNFLHAYFVLSLFIGKLTDSTINISLN